MEILSNLNIFFTLLMTLVYLSFVFFAKTNDSKFTVFFMSSFINIFNYSLILKHEVNFLLIALLNLFFVLSMVFFYIHVDTKESFLSSEYIESSDIKNIITIIIFLFSFLSISYIFYSLNKDKNVLENKNINNIIVSDKNNYYKKNNLKQEKITLNINNNNYFLYNRNIEFLEKSKVFVHYNLLILFYIIILISTFIINNISKK